MEKLALSTQQQKQNPKLQQYSKLIRDCKDIPFWIEDPNNHKRINQVKGRLCCFNHYIGLPKNAEDKECPIYDYESLVVNTILQNRHTWIKKAAGLGITELILRYLAWVCLSTSQLENKSIFIVSGTREKFANELKERMEKLFLTDIFPNLELESKYTELWLNKTWIKVFPTEAIKDLRGHTNVSYLFIDEADYFDQSGWEELPAAIKRYDQKSNCKFIFVSTPNRPDGLFFKIEHDQVFKGWFKKLFLGYEYGIGKMYTQQFIDKERGSPEFEREYNLKYLGKIGNVLSPYLIDKAVDLGEKYKNTPINQYTIHSAGIDPGFSKITPLYITELDKEHGIIRVIYYEGFDNTITPEQIANRVHEIHSQYVNLKWYVDGSNRGFINQLKTKFNENLNWNKPEDVYQNMNRIIPVNFVGNHRKMLEHMVLLVSAGKVAIPKRYDRLITAMRTAQATEYSLDKENTVNDDDIDSIRLALIPYKYGARQ